MKIKLATSYLRDTGCHWSAFLVTSPINSKRNSKCIMENEEAQKTDSKKYPKQIPQDFIKKVHGRLT